MRTLLDFLRLPAATRALAVEASLLLLLARVLVAHVSMRRWRRHLDVAPAAAGPPAELSEEALGTARRLSRIVRKVARRAPFRAVCLPQAMAAQWMLRRRGVPSRLVFGARRGAEAATEFHAWLRAGGETVLGGEEDATWRAFEAGGGVGEGHPLPGAEGSLSRR